MKKHEIKKNKNVGSLRENRNEMQGNEERGKKTMKKERQGEWQSESEEERELKKEKNEKSDRRKEDVEPAPREREKRKKKYEKYENREERERGEFGKAPVWISCQISLEPEFVVNENTWTNEETQKRRQEEENSVSHRVTGVTSYSPGSSIPRTEDLITYIHIHTQVYFRMYRICNLVQRSTHTHRYRFRKNFSWKINSWFRISRSLEMNVFTYRKDESRCRAQPPWARSTQLCFPTHTHALETIAIRDVLRIPQFESARTANINLEHSFVLEGRNHLGDELRKGSSSRRSRSQQAVMGIQLISFYLTNSYAWWVNKKNFYSRLIRIIMTMINMFVFFRKSFIFWIILYDLLRLIRSARETTKYEFRISSSSFFYPSK